MQFHVRIIFVKDSTITTRIKDVLHKCYIIIPVMINIFPHIFRIRQDYGSDDVQLLINSDECSPALINLLLTGKAVKYLHNGKVIYNLEGDLLVSEGGGGP